MALWMLCWCLLTRLVIAATDVPYKTGRIPADPSGAVAGTAVAQAVISQNDPCYQFSANPPGRQDFSSPGYPREYTQGLDCVKVVNAPSYGPPVISLKFYGVFNIEADNRGQECNYDWLEIRDGRFGFSPLIGIFCGQRAPTHVRALSGHVWIRFKTDGMLEYEGFSAEYSFEDPVDEERDLIDTYKNQIDKDCKMLMDNDDGEISTTTLKQMFGRAIINATSPVDCVWHIDVPRPTFKMRMFFTKFSLAFPNECDKNFITFYGANTADSRMLRKFCGIAARKIRSPVSVSYVRLYMVPEAVEKTDIVAVYSVYVPHTNCTPDLFRCTDDTCIPKSLRCNGRRSCLFNDDEEGCVVGESCCFDTDDTCIPKSLRCNGRRSCLFNDDEEGCVVGESCCFDTDDTCIPKSLRCNGRRSCLFNDDEEGCVVDNTPKVTFTRGPYLVILIIIIMIIISILTAAFVLNLPRFQRATDEYVRRGRNSIRNAIRKISHQKSPQLPPLTTESSRMALVADCNDSPPSCPYRCNNDTCKPSVYYGTRNTGRRTTIEVDKPKRRDLDETSPKGPLRPTLNRKKASVNTPDYTKRLLSPVYKMPAKRVSFSSDQGGLSTTTETIFTSSSTGAAGAQRKWDESISLHKLSIDELNRVASSAASAELSARRAENGNAKPIEAIASDFVVKV